MSNQDIDGKLPPEAGPAGAAPAAGPQTLEQQLAKEREARALMRDRLRHTEALAAESHALRARMAQELEKVTADRDRLRNANAAPTPAPAAGRPAEPLFTPTMAPPPMMAPRLSDAPLKPPAPPSRKGPWLSLAMLGVVAAVVGTVAWYTGARPGDATMQTAALPTTAASVVAADDSTASSAVAAVAATPAPAASTTVAGTPPSPGAVALPPMTPTSPEAQLAAAPTAAGPAALAAPVAMPARLRKALDGEGITAQVDVDAAGGLVMVADPQADAALRERTDMVIRAVYAGAGLPEPQIEHRWMSPMHGTHVTPAAADTPAPAPVPPPAAPLSPAAAAYAARHASAEHRRKPADMTVADAEELRPVLPSGRITASCMGGLAGKGTARRAAMTACMKHACTSSAASHNSEECRAYDKAYPFASSPG